MIDNLKVYQAIRQPAAGSFLQRRQRAVSVAGYVSIALTYQTRGRARASANPSIPQAHKSRQGGPSQQQELASKGTSTL